MIKSRQPLLHFICTWLYAKDIYIHACIYINIFNKSVCVHFISVLIVHSWWLNVTSTSSLRKAKYKKDTSSKLLSKAIILCSWTSAKFSHGVFFKTKPTHTYAFCYKKWQLLFCDFNGMHFDRWITYIYILIKCNLDQRKNNYLSSQRSTFIVGIFHRKR